MNKIICSLMVLFLLVGCAPTGTQAEGNGRAVFTITDAAADMGAVSSVKVTIDSVQVHSETDGWVTANSDRQTFDLLDLKAKGNSELMADAQIKAGTYQQLRLLISKVIVTDASGEHEAKLPSSELKIVGDFTVNADSTSTASFDFIADESLHVTGNGQYILAPVVKLETKEDADVDTNVKTDVKIKGGKSKTNIKVGMDEKGNVGIGVMIRQDLNITIDNQGEIKIGPIVSAYAKANASEDGSKNKTKAEVEVGVTA